jgi:nucleoside-diphosphate-sugar epimerase
MSNVFFTTANEINYAVIKRLKALGHHSTVLANTEETVKTAEYAGASVLRGNLTDLESYADSLKASDIVFHSPNFFNIEFFAFEGQVIDTIVNALKGLNKTIIYTSSSWVLGDTGKILADEKTPVAPISLAAPLAQFESRVLDSAKYGTRAIVIRPATVYGYKGDSVDEYIRLARADKAAYYVGNGENYVSFLALEDLVELYVAALERGVAGAVYHGSNGKALKSKEYAEIVSTVFGFKSVGLPQSELKAKFGALAEAYSLDQQIAFNRSKEELKWEPKNIDLLSYIKRVEQALTVNVK